MRTNVTLYEFMPYGAPELLESRRRHMSRALVVTSIAALALYALTGGLSLLLPDLPPRPTRVAFQPEPYVITQPPMKVSPPAPRAPAAPVTHPAAPPVPVREEIAPPSEVPAPALGRTDETGTGEAPVLGEGTATGPVTESLPAFGTWIYVEQEPRSIREVKPEYPSIARDAGVEGRVTVHVLVGKDGRVVDAVLASKVQVPMLNAAALEAARQWVFTPGYANGRPVAVWTAIPFHFRLH